MLYARYSEIILVSEADQAKRDHFSIKIQVTPA